MISLTGQLCYIHGFYDDFGYIKDVTVAQVATAFQSESGAVYIIVVNMALYVGPSIDQYLINPHHINHYCIPLSDNQFDSDKDFVI